MEEQQPNSILPQDLNQETTPEEEKDSILPLEEPKVKKKNFVLIGILIFLFLIVSGSLAYYLLARNTNEIEEDVKEDSEVSADVEEDVLVEGQEELKGNFTNRIFYKKDGGVFSYNIETGEILQWLSTDVKHFFEIDQNNIGFSTEDTESYPYRYTINTFNIQTGEQKELLSGENLQSLGFYSPVKFAYSTSSDSLEDSGKVEIKVFLYESGNIFEIDKSLSPMTGVSTDLLVLSA